MREDHSQFFARRSQRESSQTVALSTPTPHLERQESTPNSPSTSRRLCPRLKGLGQSVGGLGDDDLGGNGGAPWSPSPELGGLSTVSRRGRHYSQNPFAQTFFWVKGRFVRAAFAGEPSHPKPSLTRGAYRRRRFHGLIGALDGFSARVRRRWPATAICSDLVRPPSGS